MPLLTCNAIPRLVYADFTLSERLFGPQEVIRNLKHFSYSTFIILILRKIFACPSGKLSTEFTSPIAKSTSPGLSDTTFFAPCLWKVLLESKVLLSSNFFHTNLLSFLEIQTLIKSHSLMAGASNLASVVFPFLVFLKL